MIPFSKRNFLIFLAVLLVLGIFVLTQVYDTGDRGHTPSLSDKDTYYISSKEPGPKIYEASFDPLGSAAPGMEQRVRVKVRYEAPVESVSVKMIMDNGEYPYSLALKEGSAEDGVWEGVWTVSDTHSTVYQARIETKSGKTISQVVLSFQPTP